MTSDTLETSELDRGPQPLDALMTARGIDNHDLVNVSIEQLTHKQVQRARKGRVLTLKMMQKVARAFNVAVWNQLSPEHKERYQEYIHKHLFNYSKGYDASAPDINASLWEELDQIG